MEQDSRAHPAGTDPLSFAMLHAPSARDQILRQAAALAARMLRAPAAIAHLLESSVPGKQRASHVWISAPFSAGDEERLLHHCPLGHVATLAEPWRVGDLRDHAWFRSSDLVVQSGIVAALAVPCSRDDGTIVGVLCVMDVTPRRWSGEQVRILKDLADLVTTAGSLVPGAIRPDWVEPSRLVAENAMEAIITIDETSTIQFTNPAVERVFGYTPEELLGRPMTDLIPERFREAHNAGIKRFTSSGQRRLNWKGNELPGLRKDGTEVPLEVSFAVSERDGRRLFTGIMRDISERKQAEEDLRKSQEQLHQAQKMEAVGRLAGGVAHDFNNMLSVVRGNAEMVLLDLPEDSPGREELAEIQRASDRAAGLTQQLLAFSRKQVLELGDLDLNDVVTGMDKMLRRLIGASIELVTVLEPALGNVRADAGRVEQVLMNLAINARDAMKEGGKLVIRTANGSLTAADFPASDGPARPGPHVLLEVTDTGCGIRKQELSQIFEPFFTTKERGEGTGLGLSTVYGIVKQSGGHITVRSAPGEGSTFRVYFPQVERTDGEPGEGKAGEVEGGSETILLVEDEDMVRRLTRRILERNGYTVLEAANGDEALRVAETCAGMIHLVLTDLVMPLIGGRELARRIRVTRPDLRVLFMSGYTDGAGEEEILRTGMPLLRKPFRAEELLTEVRRTLGR